MPEFKNRGINPLATIHRSDWLYARILSSDDGLKQTVNY